MSNVKREFTGVFIPAHIWERKDLIPAEKMLLGEIDALSKNNGWCTAGRKHFAEWLHCDPANVSYYTKKLESLGFLEVSRTAGAGSKMRVKNAAFYRSEVVNGTDWGGKRGLGVPVNGTDGGGKRCLPKREDKYNDERKEKENAPENSVFSSTLEEGGKTPPPIPAAPPSWRDRPNTDTPVRMFDDLAKFYAVYNEDWRLLLDSAGATYDLRERREIMLSFCSYQIENNRTANTYRQTHAALQRWFIGQKAMRKPAAQKSTISKTAGSDVEHYRKPQAF